MAKLNRKKADRIRADVSRWDDYWKYNTAIYHEMTQFIMGEQWKEDEAKLFETYKKIPLTVNKIAPLMNHLIGEQRQNTPNLQIMPSDDVPEQAAEVREALIKEISLNSNARVHYQTAFQQAAVGGFGALKINSEYESNESFDQGIRIGSFIDPTKCYWDLSTETPCKTDGMCSGFRTTMSRKKFAQMWGKDIEKRIGTTSTDITDSDKIGMSFSDENSITVIDDFRRRSKMETLYGLSNDKVIKSKEFNQLERVVIDDKEMLIHEGEVVTIVNERTFPVYTVIHSKWAGDYELESTTFPSEQLPIVFVDQNSYYDKNGKQVTRPFFKDARDSQRYVNYLRTQMAYLVKISRYDQFMASKNNVRSNDTAAIWRDPATVQGALFYDESESGAKPEQLRPPELSQSLLLQYQEAANDIQVTCGMFDTQIGQQGNEVSGAAIDARTERGNYNTFVPFDSINRAITCCGTIINEMIPSIYDTQRKMQLDLKSAGRRQVILNEPADDYGTQIKNDMTEGQYKIRLVPGASFENQKRQDLQSMDLMIQHDPDSFRLVADLYAENLPMSNSIEIRNRYRTMVPPEIIEAGKTGQPLPPKPQQPDPVIMIKIQELKLKQQEATMDFQIKQQQIQQKENEMMMKAHMAGTDFSKELAKLEADKELNQAKMRESEMRFHAEMERIQADQNMNHSQNVVKILTHQPNHFKQSEKGILND